MRPTTHAAAKSGSWRLTADALVGDFEVGLEVLGTRLYDRVHGGDEQRAVGAAAADRVHERRHVGSTAERLRIHAADTPPRRPHPPVPRPAHGDHVISSTGDVTSGRRRTAQLQRLGRTALL